MMLLRHEALGVGHQAKDTTGLVLEPGDLMGAAIDVARVEKCGTAVLDVGAGDIIDADEAAFGVSDWQFELVRNFVQVRAR